MVQHPSYEDLEQRVRELEREMCELRLMEHQLGVSERRFYKIFHSSSDGMVLTDQETRKFYFANKTFCRMLGYREREIKELRVEDIHPHSELPRVLREFERLKAQTNGTALAIPVKKKDGVIFYSDITCSTLDVDGGTYLLGIFRDLTTYYETERKYRHLFEHLIDAAFLADTETGIILDANRQAEKLIGLRRSEIIGMHQTSLHPDDQTDKYRKMFADHIAAGSAFDLEAEVALHDGGAVPVLISGSVFEYGGKRLLLGLFRDITEKKRSEENLTKEIEQRKQIQEVLIKRDAELRVYADKVEDSNRVLKVLLEKAREARQEIEETMLLNMSTMVMPLVEKLKHVHANDRYRDLVDGLESSLKHITSSFASMLTSQYSVFTSAELRIAGLIKEGKGTKEIAAVLNLSKQTVEFHRKNIRKKIGLKSKKDNLRSFLCTLQ